MGDVFATFAKLAGLVDDITDTKTAGHKMAAHTVMSLQLSKLNFSQRGSESRGKTAVRMHFVLIPFPPIGLVMLLWSSFPLNCLSHRVLIIHFKC